jgi:hypothetical protein
MEKLNKKAQMPKKTDYGLLETGLAMNEEAINQIQAQTDELKKVCTKRFKVLTILNLIQQLLLIAILL